MVDRRLVEDALREEASSEYNVLRADGRIVACFYDDDFLGEERARQAALGKRALQLLAKVGAQGVWKVEDDQDAYNIVRELRGES